MDGSLLDGALRDSSSWDGSSWDGSSWDGGPLNSSIYWMWWGYYLSVNRGGKGDERWRVNNDVPEWHCGRTSNHGL